MENLNLFMTRDGLQNDWNADQKLGPNLGTMSDEISFHRAEKTKVRGFQVG
jgi:hypothetical protein